MSTAPEIDSRFEVIFQQAGAVSDCRSILGGLTRCSRICSCQSTQKPQGSTGIGLVAGSNSIENTYFHSIPTEFNKWSHLLWDIRHLHLVAPPLAHAQTPIRRIVDGYTHSAPAPSLRSGAIWSSRPAGLALSSAGFWENEMRGSRIGVILRTN